MLVLHLALGVCGVGATPLLSDMAAAIEGLGRYEVRFIISMGGAAAAVDGYYLVDGDRFFLSIADQQIFGDGAERCSVNHNLREVVLERLPDDESQSLVVVNPVAAFTELAQEFEAVVEAADGETTTLLLTPKTSDGIVDRSLLEIDNTTHLPRSISYEAEGDEISLVILSILPTEENVDMIYPADYEVIDIR